MVEVVEVGGLLLAAALPFGRAVVMRMQQQNFLAAACSEVVQAVAVVWEQVLWQRSRNQQWKQVAEEIVEVLAGESQVQQRLRSKAPWEGHWGKGLLFKARTPRMGVRPAVWVRSFSRVCLRALGYSGG